MQNSNWSLQVALLGIGVLLFGVPSQAQLAKQTKKPEHTLKIDHNPFDFVQRVAENPGQYQKNQKLTTNASRIASQRAGSSLKYHKKFSSSPQQSQAIYNSLVQQYGQPKSVRGKSHVWDIENSGKSASQADIVTVILKMEKSGAYEIIMDRDRGENGKASWDATRLQKANDKKENALIAKQQKSKPQPILKTDND